MSITTFSHGVMEGNGAYNRHAKLQADGVSLAIPLFERALEEIRVEDGDHSIVIADYGSSQGKNSLDPMGIAIRRMRRLVGSERAISVFHIDQPTNDFNSLFRVLSSDPDRYTRDDPRVFPYAIGRSFYEQVLASNSVHVAWSSYAAVWLSRAPDTLSDHLFPLRTTGAARAAFEHQAAEDWEKFLSLRATEMRCGGCMVVVLPTLPEDGSAGFAELMDRAHDALDEMANEGTITGEERRRMVLTCYGRSTEELLSPFAKTGQFQGLVVKRCESAPVRSALWLDYLKNHDPEWLASRQAQFFRAVFMPSLAADLAENHNRNGSAITAFADRLQKGMALRLARRPAPMDTNVQTIVLAKC